MTFLSGQDDFFQTANQPISVRHLSEPYNNKDLLTECEVCTGKYCLRFFVQAERRRSEVCAIKTEGNTFPYRTSKRG